MCGVQACTGSEHVQGLSVCRVHLGAGSMCVQELASSLCSYTGAYRTPNSQDQGGERGRRTSDSPLDLGFAFICISIFTTKELNKKTLKDPVHQLLMLESFG